MKYSAKTSKKGRAKNVARKGSKKRFARNSSPKKRVVKRRPQKIVFVSKPSSVSESKPETSSLLILSLIGLLIVGIGVGVYFLLRDEKQPEPKKIRYSCDKTKHQCVENPSGEYDELKDCNAACVNNDSHDCSENGCVRREDGSGAYPSLAACQDDCTMFKCQDGKCIQDNHNGIYRTKDKCETNPNCKPPEPKKTNWVLIISIIAIGILVLGLGWFLYNTMNLSGVTKDNMRDINIMGGSAAAAAVPKSDLRWQQAWRDKRTAAMANPEIKKKIGKIE